MTLSRLIPSRPLPPYSYVPGATPHPLSDPQGHSYQQSISHPEPIDPENWQACEDYLFGIDLFNHGFFWEAHEVWEGLWHAAGRKGTVASFLKGLIQLAVTGVKVYQEIPTAVVRHAQRAAELFEESQHDHERLLGFSIAELITLARGIHGEMTAEELPLLRPQEN